MMERKLEVKNEDGLQARVAALVVRVANKYTSEITLEANGERVNGKSIIGIMSLGIFGGETVKIYAEGPDSEEALNELSEIL